MALVWHSKLRPRERTEFPVPHPFSQAGEKKLIFPCFQEPSASTHVWSQAEFATCMGDLAESYTALVAL